MSVDIDGIRREEVTRGKGRTFVSYNTSVDGALTHGFELPPKLREIRCVRSLDLAATEHEWYE